MELSKQVISLEQAKRLKELGVKQESLFYHTHFTGNGSGYSFSSKSNDIQHKSECRDYKDIGDYDFENSPLVPEGAQRAGRYRIASAYTVAELGEMFGIGSRATEWLRNHKMQGHISILKMTDATWLADCLIEAVENGLIEKK